MRHPDQIISLLEFTALKQHSAIKHHLLKYMIQLLRDKYEIRFDFVQITTVLHNIKGKINRIHICVSFFKAMILQLLFIERA